MINICLTQKFLELLQLRDMKKEDYLPAYGGESAGLDLYNCGETIEIYPESQQINSDIKKSVLIPTGIKIDVPKGYVALVQERGSVTKTPLKVRAGVIDSGFTGEIFVNCINTGPELYTIYKYNKLPFQIIVVKCDNNFSIVSDEEYVNLTSLSKRQERQVGSSD